MQVSMCEDGCCPACPALRLRGSCTLPAAKAGRYLRDEVIA